MPTFLFHANTCATPNVIGSTNLTNKTKIFDNHHKINNPTIKTKIITFKYGNGAAITTCVIVTITNV